MAGPANSAPRATPTSLRASRAETPAGPAATMQHRVVAPQPRARAAGPGPRAPQAPQPRLWAHPAQRRGDAAVCLAHPRRVAKVSSQIQREISEMFIYDKVVQEAICPERRAGLDDRLSAVASVTHAHVSNDLQVVKVYVSVYSDEEGRQRAIANLKQIAPYVRSRIGAALKLRLTPEVRFEYDSSLDDLEKIQEAIGQEDFDRYVSEGQGGGAAAAGAAAGAWGADKGAAREGEGGEEDDDDGGFFDIPAGAAGGEQGEAAGPGPQSRRVAWSRHDPETFFAVDVDEDEEGEEEGAGGGGWYSRAGPFDHLFSGDGGDTVVQPRRRRRPQQQQQPRQQQRRQQQQQQDGGGGE